jgi:hypothetical protein
MTFKTLYRKLENEQHGRPLNISHQKSLWKPLLVKKINNDKPPTCDFHKGKNNPVQGHSLDLEHELVIKKI